MNFTGERVVPGKVTEDLWAEHISRYAYASQWASDARVLDIGSGTGYGTALLAKAAQQATGIDASTEAAQHAQQNYGSRNLAFAAADAARLPFTSSSFGLVTAFEVIEHTHEWRALLNEARRVLRPSGLFLVSTPNRTYYTESRGEAGANPYHVHEFDFQEFCAALSAAFPHFVILLQNHATGFGFYRHGSGTGANAQFESWKGTEGDAYFFLGVCSLHPISDLPNFVYIPQASNVLKERGDHIRSLAGELDEARNERDSVIASHQALTKDLAEKIAWAQSLDMEITKLRAALSDAENTVLERTRWAQNLDAEIQKARQLIAEVQKALTERTLLAEQLSRRIEECEESLELYEGRLTKYEASRWIRLGRKFGLGPDFNEASAKQADDQKDS